MSNAAAATADTRAGDAACPTPAARILFVDDDESLLEGLRDALYPYRHRWAMSFATDGEQALAALSTAPCDVIVCDLRMPGIDGAALLELVRDRSPSTVRIILSGHADIKVVSRAAAVAHRLIAKPCGTEELAGIIERSCALRNISDRVELDERAIGVAVLPSVPRVYGQLCELLRSGSAGASDIAEVIGTDIAMAAKVLQLANSAYFGRRCPTASVADAVAYLGTDTIRALLLYAGAFHAFQVEPPIPGFDLDGLQHHCVVVARLAAAILKDGGGSGDAFTAGLLHDVGLLVLAAQARDELAGLLNEARERSRTLVEIEREKGQATHAEIGAHLLALWGLPHDVTEAVAGHHEPSWLKLPFDAVAAVQAANTLVRSVNQGGGCRDGQLDDYLEHAGLIGHLDRWRESAAALAG